jgi:cell division protein FtsQ
MSVKARRRGRLRLVLAGAAVLALLVGGWLWLRDSRLVAVRKVSVTGVSGPDAAQVRAALILAARNQTTLDVHSGALRTAVAPYPVVKDLKVSTQFPNGMRIRVVEQLPVGAVGAGGRAIAATGDGTLLHDVASATLPMVPVAALPAGSRVIDRPTLQALALLGDSPRRLLGRIAQVTVEPPRGLVAQLRSGPSIYFGEESDLAAKWAAAIAVLADPGSAGASYIDVTDPARPVAGASPQAVAAAGLATSGAQAPASGSPLLGGGSPVPATGSLSPAAGPQTPTQTSTSGG